MAKILYRLMRGLFGSIAAVLLCLPFAGCGPLDASSQNDARLLFTGLDAALLSVSGTSDSDVYAVGADPGLGGPYVLHYNGQSWRRLRTGTTGDLWWISVTPIEGSFYMAGTEGKVLRYDPIADQFTSFDTPGDGTVFGVWGTSAVDLWAVGGDLDSPDDSGFVWRYDGAVWNVVDLSGTLPDGTPLLYKVWGQGANDVYVVGRLGTMLHFDGTALSRLTTNTTRTLFTIHGNADRVVAVGGAVSCVILEEEGEAFVDRASADTPQMNGVFIAADGGGVAVGNEASVVRRTSNGWVLQDYEFNTLLDFHGTWVDPRGGVWAVGGDLSGALNQGMLAYIGRATISTDVDR